LYVETRAKPVMKSAARLLLLTSLHWQRWAMSGALSRMNVHASLTEGEQSDYGIKSERQAIDGCDWAHGEKQ
jgi:hypothetical protein